MCNKEDLTSILYNSGLVNIIKIVDTAGRKDRKDAIIEYLEKNEEIKNNYIILDDEEEFYDDNQELMKHLILCNSYGFGFEDYLKSKEILEKGKVKKLVK